MFRFVTIDPLVTATPAPEEDDLENQVGLHDQDSLSLAKLRNYSRLRRAINFVYPSNFPQDNAKQSFLSFPKSSKSSSSPVLPANPSDVSYVYPQSYTQSSSSKPHPVATTEPTTPSPPSSSPSSSSTSSSSFSYFTTSFSSSPSALTRAEDSPSDDNANDNDHDAEEEEDYDDWNVVVNVIKSESSSTETILMHDASLATAAASPTTTAAAASTRRRKPTTAAPLAAASSSSSRFGNNRPAVESKVQQHPFVLGRAARNESTTRIAHPFLAQIKTTTPISPATTTTTLITQTSGRSTEAEATTATRSSTTTITATTTTTARPSLFARNRKRPSLFPSRTLKTEASKKPVKQKSVESIKSLFSKSRSLKQRPKLNLLSKNTANKEDSINNAKKETTSTTAVVRPTEATKPKLSALFTKPGLSHSKFGLSPLTPPPTQEIPVSSIIEKPRPKRLPPPFTGTRNSLFRNRFKAPSILAKKVTTAATTTEAVTQDNADIPDSLLVDKETKEKLTVEEFIAEVNGENEEDKTLALRTNSFKPKESPSKIREKLLAELAKNKKDEDDNEDDGNVEDNAIENNEITTAKPSKPVRQSSRASLLRGRLSLKKPNVSTTRSNLFSGSRQRSRGRARPLLTRTTSGRLSASSALPPTTTTTGTTVVRQLNHETKDMLKNLVSVDKNMHAEENDDDTNVVGVTKSPFQALEANAEDAHDLVHQHHPQIAFRHLKPDLLTPAQPPSSPSTQQPLADTTTLLMTDGGESKTESAPVATTLSSRIFVPTISRETTVQQDETTVAASFRGTRRRIPARRRSQAETSSSTVAATSQASRIRPRLRSRARQTAARQPNRPSETPRSSGASRRRLNIRNRVDISADKEKVKLVPARGRRRRIKGRGGRSTTTSAPASSSAVAEEATTLPPTTSVAGGEEEADMEKMEVDMMTTVRPEGKGKPVDRVVSNHQEITTMVPDEVDTSLTVVNAEDQVGQEDTTTPRPRTFLPKVSNKSIREKLLQTLRENKTEEAGSGGAHSIFDLRSVELGATDNHESTITSTTTTNITPAKEIKELRQSRRFNPVTRGLTHRRPNYKRTPSKKDRFAPTPVYDTRPKRNNGVTEAAILNRAGRSTISTLSFTENPLRLEVEDSSASSLVNRIPVSQNEIIKESKIRPFLLRGGKGHRLQFGDRYDPARFLPEKPSDEKRSGPNPSSSLSDFRPTAASSKGPKARRKDKSGSTSLNSILIPLVSKGREADTTNSQDKFSQKIFFVTQAGTDQIRQGIRGAGPPAPSLPPLFTTSALVLPLKS